MPFEFLSLPLQDVVLVTPKIFGDERGWFMETYHQEQFATGGITNKFVQDNHSLSMKGVLRGLHFQTLYTQAKLVRVSHGSVYDMIVDLRQDSSTYGKGYCVLLSSKNNFQLFIPKGFAHGFITLEDNTEFLYKCDDLYAPNHENGIHWASKEIQWIGHSPSVIITESFPSMQPLISAKDTNLPELITQNKYF